MFSRTLAVGLTQLAIMVAVVGCLGGCGSGQGAENSALPDYTVSGDSISSNVSHDRLTEAARRENQKPLWIQFSATEKVSRQIGLYEMTIRGLYDGSKFLGVRVTLNDQSVDFTPRSLVTLIGKSVVFDVHDEQGAKVAEPIVVKLASEAVRLKSRTDWETIGKWLIGVGAVAIALALPALLAAGVFGVALVITVGVARLIGSLIWAVFQIGLLAVGAGLVIAIWRLFVSDASAEKVKVWFSNLWQKIVGIVNDLNRQLEPKGASTPIDLLILLFVLLGYPNPRRHHGTYFPARAPG